MKRHEQIQIKARANQIAVSVPFCEEFNTAARQLGGKFDRATTAWIIDQRHEDRIRERLFEFFGTDGSPVETVTVEIDLDAANWRGDDKMMIGGWEILRKSYRDTAPAVRPGGAVIAGQLLHSGGSRNNPRITWADGTIIEVADFPASLIDNPAGDFETHFSRATQITARQPLEPETEAGYFAPELRETAEQAARVIRPAQYLDASPETADRDPVTGHRAADVAQQATLDALAAADPTVAVQILETLTRIMGTGNGNGPSAPEIVLAALLNYEIDIAALIAEVDTAD